VLMNKINPFAGGMELIRTMWRTEAGGFKNESQNYSQIALASIINFDRLINQDMDTVYLVQGDKEMRMYREKTKYVLIHWLFLTIVSPLMKLTW